MSNSSGFKGVAQMAGSNQTSMKKVLFRVVGLAIVFAVAAAPAFAGGDGPGGSGNGAPKTTIAVDAMSALGSLSLPGCGVSVEDNLAGCQTTMRVSTDAASANACVSDRVYLTGTPQQGLCRVAGVRSATGSAPVKVSTNHCNSIYVWRPADAAAPRVTLQDAVGQTWTLDRFVLRAGDYQRSGAVDTWKLEPGSGLTTTTGSWAIFTAGAQQLVMWLNGTLVSTGNCQSGVDSASFTMHVTTWGFVQR